MKRRYLEGEKGIWAWHRLVAADFFYLQFIYF